MCKNENYIKCFKDTFFNVKRVEAGLTIKEVAEYVGLCPSSVAAFMSGEKMPKDKYIDRLCELFDVDPVRGKSEFMRAHDKWDAEFGKTVKFRVPTTEQPAEPEPKVKAPNSPVIEGFMNFMDDFSGGDLDVCEDTPVEDKVVPVADDAPDFSAVLELLYGKVDFATFKAVSDKLRGE